MNIDYFSFCVIYVSGGSLFFFFLDFKYVCEINQERILREKFHLNLSRFLFFLERMMGWNGIFRVNWYCGVCYMGYWWVLIGNKPFKLICECLAVYFYTWELLCLLGRWHGEELLCLGGWRGRTDYLFGWTTWESGRKKGVVDNWLSWVFKNMAQHQPPISHATCRAGN